MFKVGDRVVAQGRSGVVTELFIGGVRNEPWCRVRRDDGYGTLSVYESEVTPEVADIAVAAPKAKKLLETLGCKIVLPTFETISIHINGTRACKIQSNGIFVGGVFIDYVSLDLIVKASLPAREFNIKQEALKKLFEDESSANS